MRARVGRQRLSFHSSRILYQALFVSFGVAVRPGRMARAQSISCTQSLGMQQGQYSCQQALWGSVGSGFVQLADTTVPVCICI